MILKVIVKSLIMTLRKMLMSLQTTLNILVILIPSVTNRIIMTQKVTYIIWKVVTIIHSMDFV